MVKIYREEGFLVYYRGLVFILFGIVLYVGISFFIYEFLKKVYFDVVYDVKKLYLFYRFFFGVCVGFFG